MPQNSEGSGDDYPESWGALVRGMEAWRRFAALIPAGETMTVIRKSASKHGVAGAQVIHRDFPGLVFEVALSDDGRLRSLAVNPYEWSDDVLEGMPELTSRLLRRVPLGEVQAVAARAITQLTERSHALGRWAQVLRDTPRPGKRGRPDRFYAELAADYCSQLGSSSTPVKDLADAVGYSESQIRNLLYEARRRDLLSSSPSGRAGGSLTTRARELLAAEKED